jgi:RNA polymerase sigma-70 factor (ECF subfamily)
VAELTELAVVDLVSRARRGDGSAFEELIRRHERLALGVAYGVLHDAQLAGDVVQEAFLKAWRTPRRPGAGRAVSPRGCAGSSGNLCVDHRRRKRVAVCGIEEARGEADVRSPEPGEAMDRRERGPARRRRARDAGRDDADRRWS